MHNPQCNSNCPSGAACTKGKCCWQHITAYKAAMARQLQSNSSSTSSGCDSNASSAKENFCGDQQLSQHKFGVSSIDKQQQQQQHHSLTPQQLEQLRSQQQLQKYQLELLHQQVLQRRRLQQQLREQGVGMRRPMNKTPTVANPTLTCNQQYLRQMRIQQLQQQLPNELRNFRNDNQGFSFNDNDIINNNNNNDNYNNNNNNNNDYCYSSETKGFGKGQKFRRGMTEYPTNNDISNNTHLSQPLQNSPRHFHYPHQNSPKHLASISNHFTHTNSSNNTINNNFNKRVTPTSSTPTSAAQSPLHYRNPFNSPSNTPYVHAYYAAGDHQNFGKSPFATTQLQQHLRSHKLPLQQHLNDLLLQQQHLQQHQQQLLRNSVKDNVNGDTSTTSNADELSEESLKQNVAIVLNNLDRYNNALRSIILNEQVTSSSSVYFDENSSLLIGSDGGNNNFLIGSEMAMATPATPESDFNSNATTPGSRGNLLPFDSCGMMQPQQPQNNMVGLGVLGNVNGGGVGGGNGYCSATGGTALNCSLASSHDFTHDNSDYQWFLDYGYRDGCAGMQRSVLSSLSASYNGIGDLIYYEDLAKNLDANLAEVDMESFRAEDIHSLLSQLPSYCKSLGSANSRLQQSLMFQQHQQQQQQHQNNMMLSSAQYAHNMTSQMSNASANEYIDNSICKSELLFSPVKESSHISVDSLDMDGYPDEGDMILTCKANKDNYTIAFEGSVLYSDDSFYEPNEIAMKNKHNYINLHSNLDDIVKRKSMEMSMSRSEQAINNRGKMQKSHTTQLQRYPSGNNNTAETITITRHLPSCLVRKSSSLPNLHGQHEILAMATTCQRLQQLNVSQVFSTSTVESCKLRNLLPMCQMPISACNSTNASMSERLTQKQLQPNHQLQPQQQQHRHKHRCCCSNSSSSAAGACASGANINNQSGTACTPQKHAHISGSTSSGNSNPPAFNLVKLFIKQKSSNCSSEEQISAHTCMDVSSGCWPSSDAAGSSSSSSLEQRLRKKSMNDSGKGSALSRHDEEELMRDHAQAKQESAFDADNNVTEPSTPKKYLRMRNDAVFYDEDPSSSSTSSLTATNSPAHRRRSMPLRNPQLNNVKTSAGSCQSSEASRSNSEQLTTQMYMSSGNGSSGVSMERKQSRQSEANRRVSATSSSEMVTRSMQTSCGGSLSSRSSISERLRCVPPSFLSKLNKLGEERQAPIYVIYPNYALPDLGFVKTSSAADVIFSPFNYKMAVGGTASQTSSSLKKRISFNGNEDEILKNIDYKHVMDWESLATLLPVEYRRRLKHIPEVNRLLLDLEGELSQRPLFCMTPPMRRNRPNICDCAKYFQQQQQQHTQLPVMSEEGGNSSSSSSQQPSSGYRGSSTLLTDSELDNANPLRQMYVYQYEQTRMDSAIDMSPATPQDGKIIPQPMPRGILRKTSQSGNVRNKRNSMIENQQTKLTKLEKRRSLQEPSYQTYAVAESGEELGWMQQPEQDGIYAMPQSRKEQRLSRKDVDARIRAENFLSSLPRSELKHYAEIAAILESESCEGQLQYDSVALKKEVSRALSQQKKVSFNDTEEEGHQLAADVGDCMPILSTDKRNSRFTTPPNSPNISMANGARAHTTPRRCSQAELHERRKSEEKQQRKIESNRFKRLQIQWELMSKDSSMLKDLANEHQTKSGGSTPTTANATHKSRIPRPVSYPAGKRTENSAKNTNTNTRDIANNTTTPTKAHKTLPSTEQYAKPIKPTCVSPKIARISTQDANVKTARSPSRIVPPKRYSVAGSPNTVTMTSPLSVTGTTPPAANVGTGARTRTPNGRGGAMTAPTTPKRSLPSSRTIPRVR